MKVIVPKPITDSIFLDCTVQETDYQQWSGQTTYALGDQAVRASTHKIYQALKNNIGAKDVRVGSDASEVLDMATDGAGGFAALISDTYTNRALKIIVGQVVDGNLVMGTPVDVSAYHATGYSGCIAYDSRNSSWVVVYQVVDSQHAFYTIVPAGQLTPLEPTIMHELVVVGGSAVLVDYVSPLIYVPTYNRLVLSTSSGVMVGTRDGTSNYMWGAPVMPTGAHEIYATDASALGEVVACGQSATPSCYPIVAAVDVSAQTLVPVWGTPVVVESVSGFMSNCVCVADVTVRRFVAMRSDYSFYPCSVSGTTVTVGTKYASGLTMENTGLTFDTSSKTFVAMYQNSDGTAGYGIPITLTDTNTITFGTPTPFTLEDLDGPYCVAMGDGHITYMYQDESAQIHTGYNIGGPARFGVSTTDGTTIDFSGDVYGVPELMTVSNYTDPLWLEVGATNRWRQFDYKITSKTAHTVDGALYYESTWDESADSSTILSAYEARPLVTKLQPGPIDSVALIGVTGRIAKVIVTGGDGNIKAGYTKIVDGIESWALTDLSTPDAISTSTWDESADTSTLTDSAVPIYTTLADDETIEVRLYGHYGETVSIAETVIGNVRDLGGTQSGLTAGITDYSVYTYDEYGDITTTKRGYRKRIDLQTLVNRSDLSNVYRYLSNLRADNVVWIPSDDDTIDGFDGLMAFGKFKEFKVKSDLPNYAYCEITIDGLITE